MEQTHRGPAMVGELPNDFLRSDSQLNRTQGEQESSLEKSRKLPSFGIFWTVWKLIKASQAMAEELASRQINQARVYYFLILFHYFV